MSDENPCAEIRSRMAQIRAVRCRLTARIARVDHAIAVRVRQIARLRASAPPRENLPEP